MEKFSCYQKINTNYWEIWNFVQIIFTPKITAIFSIDRNFADTSSISKNRYNFSRENCKFKIYWLIQAQCYEKLLCHDQNFHKISPIFKVIFFNFFTLFDSASFHDFTSKFTNDNKLKNHYPDFAEEKMRQI